MHWTPPYYHMKLAHAETVYNICNSWKAIPVEAQGKWIKSNPEAYESVILPLTERLFT